MEMYELYQESPELIDPQLAELFKHYRPPAEQPAVQTGDAASAASGVAVEPNRFEKVLAAVHLAEAIRAHGHLA
ncbi:hypothetical protein, partial [Tritonibacter sp. SIMBA_163]|uniref:hypothetical protein n=1 Tax=Tritonibacter sp. SIMBA_163 TaxID=3080868 RepID=UPI00398130ED